MGQQNGCIAFGLVNSPPLLSPRETILPSLASCCMIDTLDLHVEMTKSKNIASNAFAILFANCCKFEVNTAITESAVNRN